MKQSRAGFTLVELLTVIAIIAIISTLAIQKLSGLKIDAKEKVNLANVVRIGNALETHVAASGDKARFDRLDALTLYGASRGSDGDTSALSQTAALMIYTNETNRGLSPSLWNGPFNAYFAAVPVLGTYYLTEAEARALHDDLGMDYIMRGTDGGRFTVGDDTAWLSDDVKDPLRCASIATFVTNGLAVAAVNPGATVGDVPVGADIYKACGERVYFAMEGRTASIVAGGAKRTDNRAAFEALREGEGILLAFGIGDNASIVGSNLSGLDSAPVCAAVDSAEYGRYLVLVRLVRGSADTVRAEYAGVMDARGRTAAMLR